MNIKEIKRNLPKIEDNINIKEKSHREKYLNLYLKIILRCINMKKEELSGYNENHHIIPKCLGGSNSKDNLVLMPIRYHIMAHIILLEVYPENVSIAAAVNIILNGSFNKDDFNNKLDLKFSTRFISNKIEESKNILKLKYLGSNNPNRKIIIGPTDKIYGSIKEASKENNIPYSTLTKWLDGTSLNNHGWRYYDGIYKTEYHNRNMEKSSKKVIGPKGKVYESIIQASIHEKIPYTTLRYWLSGRTKNNHGWKYLIN